MLKAINKRLCISNTNSVPKKVTKSYFVETDKGIERLEKEVENVVSKRSVPMSNYDLKTQIKNGQPLKKVSTMLSHVDSEDAIQMFNENNN